MQTRVFAEEPDGVRLLMSSMANGQLYQMINRICEDLSSGECRRLLYLCGSLDTDRCGSGHVREVLNSWLSRGQVDQLYLVELLFRLRRFDLLKKEFHISKQEVDGILGQNRALSEYRVLMSDVSEDMGKEDLDSLKFLLSGSLSRERLTRVKSFLDVIVELEKLDRVSSERVELIEKCLRDISRVDLARKVKGYRNLTSVGTPQHRPVVMTQQAQQQWIRTPSNPMPTASTVSCHSRQEQSTQNTPENENIAEPERKRLFYQSPVDVYRLQSDPRGECLIIDCVGSDGDMLEEMFSGLQFKVTLVKWPRVGDTLSLLRQAAQPRQTQEVDAFACCIISRGSGCVLTRSDTSSPLTTAPGWLASPSCSSSRPIVCQAPRTATPGLRVTLLTGRRIWRQTGMGNLSVWRQSPTTQMSSGATVGQMRVSWRRRTIGLCTCRP
ncbi:CASP8 and FADD-like apoptosis regulator isoform X4 [Oncorhynchus masou masou]|uniref:CASP8 and FADD-like apoptosis regulator isoform X4 n=1 Tax=Oncorhynchus masou masou TaxID=90313 RepID=UPI0031831E88